MTQSCRTCVHLDRRGDTRVFEYRAYQCLAPLPEMPPLPDSITRGYGYKPVSEAQKNYVTPKDGAQCPLYEKRKK